MTKGHNKGKNNDPNPDEKTPGQHRNRTDQDKKKDEDRGRNPEKDPSDGTKGKNNVS